MQCKKSDLIDCSLPPLEGDHGSQALIETLHTTPSAWAFGGEGAALSVLAGGRVDGYILRLYAENIAVFHQALDPGRRGSLFGRAIPGRRQGPVFDISDILDTGDGRSAPV